MFCDLTCPWCGQKAPSHGLNIVSSVSKRRVVAKGHKAQVTKTFAHYKCYRDACARRQKEVSI